MKIIAFTLLAVGASVVCGGASYLASTTPEQRSRHKRQVRSKARAARQTVSEYFRTLFHTEAPTPVSTQPKAA